MASFERNTPPNLSMREKSALKRRVNKEHSSNFHAGYVPIHEDHLHKTGLRGRKRYCFYALIIFLLLVAVANLILTTIILVVLKIDHAGMQALEFIIPGRLLRFRQEADLGVLRPFDSSVNGENLIITGENQKVILQARRPENSNKGFIEVSPDEIRIKINESMKVHNPDNGNLVFSSDFIDFKMPDKLQTLSTNHMIVEKLISKVNEGLNIESDGNLTLIGNEGIYYDSKAHVISASGLLNITSENHSIILDGSTGIQTDLQLIDPAILNPSLILDTPTYKLCICLPSHYIFLVPALENGTGCEKANEVDNPCPEEEEIIEKRRPFPF